MIDLYLKSVCRGWHGYLGYVLAATLAVATFFSFGFLLFHPDLDAQPLPDVMVQVLAVGQLGIASFAVFFVTFFHRFLLRLRGKQFGLLLALGIAPRRLRTLVWVESLALAVVALAAGILLSAAETYALFGAIGRLLGTRPMRVAFPPEAVLVGAAFFGLLFLADAALSARVANAFTPKHLLSSARAGQRAPRPSAAKVVLGVACLGVAYALALVFSADPTVAIASIVPIVVLCSVGTYLLFSQCLVMVLTAVRRRTASGLVLLGASRLAHRVLDHAQVLTVVALPNAGVITLLGVFSGALWYIRQIATSPAEYQELLRGFRVALAVGVFLGVLCFIAAAATLYVKLFTQLEEDRHQFAGLLRIGVSPRGLGSLLTWELALLFFAPVLVAIPHSAVAMGENTTRLGDFDGPAFRGAWLAYAAVGGGAVAIFALCFFVARVDYRRRLLGTVTGRTRPLSSRQPRADIADASDTRAGQRTGPDRRTAHAPPPSQATRTWPP